MKNNITLPLVTVALLFSTIWFGIHSFSPKDNRVKELEQTVAKYKAEIKQNERQIKLLQERIYNFKLTPKNVEVQEEINEDLYQEEGEPGVRYLLIMLFVFTLVGVFLL